MDSSPANVIRASLMTKALSSCPSSNIVLSGYSQGGQLVHNAAKLLTAENMKAVSSVVIFGDPGLSNSLPEFDVPNHRPADFRTDSSKSVENADPEKVLVVCHTGDDICQFRDLVLLEHLTYAKDADTAAKFVVSKAGL